MNKTMFSRLVEANSGSKSIWPTLCAFMACFGYLVYLMPNSSFFLTSQDHGYQLAMGQAILNGRLPGIDYFTLYGPMVAYASALGKALTGDLIGEIIICAAGYSAALVCAFHALRKSSGILAGLVFLGGALVLLPRYYKWYFWFFPLVNYLLFTLMALSKRRTGKFFLLWGLFGGVSLLFRTDMGVCSLIFSQVCCFMALRKGYGQTVKPYMAGYLLPPLAYLALILTQGGWNALSQYGRVTFFSIWDILHTYSGLSEVNGRLHMSYHPSMLAFLIPCLAAYIIAIVWGWRHRRKGPDRQFALAVFAAALQGLCMFTQAYRPDIQHVQQMIPCYLILFSLLAERAVQRFRTGDRPTVVLALTLLLTFVVMPVFHKAKTDLAPWTRDWGSNFHILRTLPQSRPDSPLAVIASELSRITSPNEPVFITIGRTPGTLLYLSGTHLPGLFPVYAQGLLDSPRWWTLNESLIDKTPIRYLVVDTRKWKSAPPESLAPFIPNLVTRWRNEYTEVLFSVGNLAILKRDYPVNTGGTTHHSNPRGRLAQ